MQFKEFVRECYLRSVPSVDLNEVTAENPIDCRDYTLNSTVYEELVDEFANGDNDKFTAANMWCLMSGPRLVNN